MAIIMSSQVNEAREKTCGPKLCMTEIHSLSHCGSIIYHAKSVHNIATSLQRYIYEVQVLKGALSATVALLFYIIIASALS
jgi:hypothetical protein